MQADVAYHNQRGIYANENSSGTLLVGATDLSLGLGNIVHDNSNGIDVENGAIAQGNTVYGQTGSGDWGIYGGSSSIIDNVVYDNYYGIETYAYDTVENNRVYANTDAGIYIQAGDSTVQGNSIYSNPYGIYANGWWGNAPDNISNNVIYANTIVGVDLTGNNVFNFVNNTVYQSVGDAIDISGDGYTNTIENNILWVDEGHAINVASDSENLVSNYNLFYTDGAGVVGEWQGVDRVTLSAWSNASYTDKESIFADPLFVDPAGSDGILGYGDAEHDGRDDDFHLQSVYGSFHNGSLAPALNAATGLPTFLTGVWTDDGGQSPAIDRGDPTSTFSNEPGPNGGYINIGAYGNTSQASKSPAQYVLLVHPSGGTIMQDSTYQIEWRSSGFTGDVSISYSTTGPNGTFQTLVGDTANDGSYDWLVDSSIYPTSSQYVIKISSISNPTVSDTSSAPFSVSQAIHNYYVNDGSTAGDEYTSAIGNDDNDGLTPQTPKASIQSVIQAYHPHKGDTIYVDTGTYQVTTDIYLSAADAGFTIQGPVNAGDQAILNRQNTGNWVFELEGAHDVTLKDLTITGGYGGVYLSSTSNITIDSCQIYGNAQYGIYDDSGSNNGLTLTNDTVHDDGQYGAYLLGSNTTITGGSYYDNSQRGIYSQYGPTTITGVNVYGNSNGVYLYNGGSSIESSIVHDNSNGIDVENGAIAQGNTVYGQTGSGDWGIYGGSSSIIDNVVYDNYYGIETYAYETVENNRVYANTDVGIYIQAGDSTIQGNSIYSNPYGIYANGWWGNAPDNIPNNVIYANTIVGVVLTGNNVFNFVNNTVYQSVGDAIDISGDGYTNTIENNILWVSQGVAINVASNSESLTSDYNLFYLTGSGSIGVWEGRTYANIVDWAYELGLDMHSLVGDPQFVDPAGPTTSSVTARPPSVRLRSSTTAAPS